MLGKRWKQARQRAGLQQIDLAVEIEYGQSMISQIENDQKNPSVEKTIQAAIAMDVSAEYLLGLSDDPDSPGARDTAATATRRKPSTLARPRSSASRATR